MLLLAGVVMLAVSTLIILYGFKRTEELRSEAHVEALMRRPRDASYGDVPVGLVLGQGSTAMPGEGQALYEDGLLVSLLSIERERCPDCGPDGRLVATLHLEGGNVREAVGLNAKLSLDRPQWADRDLRITLLDIDPRMAVFGIEKTIR